MIMIEQIRHHLEAAFKPSSLEVIDESHLHAGHSGARQGGETHFRIRCTSSMFSGKTRLEQHRMVNKALEFELSSTIHALALELCAQA